MSSKFLDSKMTHHRSSFYSLSLASIPPTVRSGKLTLSSHLLFSPLLHSNQKLIQNIIPHGLSLCIPSLTQERLFKAGKWATTVACFIPTDKACTPYSQLNSICPCFSECNMFCSPSSSWKVSGYFLGSFHECFLERMLLHNTQRKMTTLGFPLRNTLFADRSHWVMF